MKRNLTLTHRTREPLRFSWDPDTGYLGGPDAERVSWLLRHYRDGLPLTPTGPVLALTDPLRSTDELAVLLAVDEWQLPEDLAALATGVISRQDLDVPEDAIA